MSANREIEYEKDRAEVASEEGFKGTLPAFLEWLKESLVYGGVRVHDEAPDEYGRLKIKVETVTAGYSSDEHLLGRVSRSLFMQCHWVSSRRGGSVVYEFPKDWVDNTDELVWLEPKTDVFETIHRVRRVRVYDEHGGSVEFNYESAAELLFQEPDRDVNEPDGLLIVRPFHVKSRL